MIARPGAGRRNTLYNGRLSIRPILGASHRRDLLTLEDYRAALSEHFGLILKDTDLIALHTLMATRGEAARAHPFFA